MPTALARPVVHFEEDVMQSGDRAWRFVKATANLKISKTAPGTIRDIVRAVYPEADHELASLKSRCPSRSFLANCRLQFDVVMMLIMEFIYDWHFTYDGSAASYLFIDGSPSSGFEAFIAFEHFWSSSKTWNRCMMINFLGFGFMGAAAKAFSLIWKFWLETRSIPKLRARLRLVRGICTDQGAEARIPDMPDIVPTFVELIKYPLSCVKEEFLFPLCIWLCGWHHVFDSICEQVREHV